MFPYIAIVVIIIFFLLLSSAHVADSGKVGLVVVAVALSTVAGFRAMSVGTDTRTYSTMFYWIAGCSDLSSAFTVSTINAPVYVFYAWVLGRLGLSHQALLLFNAIITNTGIAFFAKRTSDNPLIPILIYFCLGLYFQSLNGMRQYVAIALAINAYLDFYYYGIRKPRAWALFLLASGIHNTVLILLPGIGAALYLRKQDHKRKGLCFVSAIAALFSLSLVALSNVFMDLFPIYSMYDGVQNIALFSGAFQGRIRYLYAVLLVICVFGFLSLDKKDGDKTETKEINLIFALFPLCIISGIVGLVYGTSSLINRLLWFYMPGYIAFIPAVVNNTEKGWAILLRFGIASVLLIWLIAQFVENQDDMLPYALGMGLF